MKTYLKSKLSMRQYELLRMAAFEFKRWKCRVTAPKKFATELKQLQLGSGARPLKHWLNVDMIGSDLNLDIATGSLPFADNQFDVIVSQHVIAHLTLEDEFLPLLKECHRSLSEGGVIWLSTPDLEKVARSYVDHKNEDMITDRQQRIPDWNMGSIPSQHFMNDIFHQQLEHRNLFDLELLTWCLTEAGFKNVQRTDEKDLVEAHPEIPMRNDDYQSIYVRATK